MESEPRFLYADSSALTKLIVREPESKALRSFVDERTNEIFTSRLAVVEVTRAVKLGAPDALEDLEEMLAEILFLDVSEDVVARAREIASPQLRTLDAIHLASALEVDPDVLVAYDRRLVAGAQELGLAVVSPS